jgi:AcrR family transcriptional regulator
MPQATVDRRIERTRQALVGAFIGLMLEGRRYDRITIADLIERAGVGRSTFYEHYSNKDEILAETIRIPFEALAAAFDAGAGVSALRDVLRHFHDNRAHAKVIFAGAARRKVGRVLASMIEDRLRVRAQSNGVAPSASIGIAALALVDGQMGAIMAWIDGEIAGDAERVAIVLHRIAQAAASDICAR